MRVVTALVLVHSIGCSAPAAQKESVRVTDSGMVARSDSQPSVAADVNLRSEGLRNDAVGSVDDTVNMGASTPVSVDVESQSDVPETGSHRLGELDSAGRPTSPSDSSSAQEQYTVVSLSSEDFTNQPIELHFGGMGLQFDSLDSALDVVVSKDGSVAEGVVVDVQQKDIFPGEPVPGLDGVTRIQVGQLATIQVVHILFGVTKSDLLVTLAAGTCDMVLVEESSKSTVYAGTLGESGECSVPFLAGGVTYMAYFPVQLGCPFKLAAGDHLINIALGSKFEYADVATMVPIWDVAGTASSPCAPLVESSFDVVADYIVKYLAE